MHSSTLRGTDFEIFVDGQKCLHAEYFREFTNTQRLGLVAPQGVDGVGAINLIMAHVTAFYDSYREGESDFFAYPDYFTFQQEEPLADYGSFDIWPDHKSVLISESTENQLDAITDRGVNILFVPDGKQSQPASHPLQLASARRNIHTCYLYSFLNHVPNPQIVIRCKKQPFIKWARTMFDTEGLKADPIVAQRTKQWEDMLEGTNIIEQSYQKISLEDALALL